MLANDFLILIIFICADSIHGQARDCGLEKDAQITIKEPLPPDYPVFTFNTTEDVRITDKSRTYWRIDNNTLYTDRVLSLDNDTSLCHDYNFPLELECNDGNQPLTKILVVIIEAENNYPPIFQKDVVKDTIQEGMPRGHLVLNVDKDNKATDEDCSDFIFYSGESTDELQFVPQYSIQTNRMFDYEAGDRQFNMTVMAKDTPPSGDTSDQNNATFTFILYIEDVDDENPAFLNQTYTLHIQEQDTSLAGSWLAADPRVLAEDQDYGINQSVVYSVADREPRHPNPEISIHNTNGDLMVNGTLDRETADKYFITLRAAQTNNDRRSATATLTLYVDDINDNRPLFNPLTYNVSIQEHTSEGTSVIRVSAIDIDEGSNSDFTYKLLSQTDVFSIDAGTGYIHVNNSALLDRETTPQFIINVTTTESEPIVGNDKNASCYATVTVDLIDINDHSPKFNESSYTFAANNNTVGRNIGQVGATDADEGENGRIEYSIPTHPTDTSVPDFSVDKTTGWITQDNPVTGTRQMLIRACDLGEQSRCDAASVTVTIPKHAVTSANVTANVTENVPIATPVYIIPDSYTGYRLILNPHSDTFKLSTETTPGIVITDTDIDRENISRYTVHISVNLADTANATITVSIRVLDQNDNTPVFNKSSYDFHIKDDAKAGDVVGSVAAYDYDEGINSEITFNIQGTQSSQQFEVDSGSGLIKLLKVPDLAREYTEIVMVATDNGEIPLKASTAVKVYVGWKPGKVRFFAPAGKEDVDKDQDELISEMSNILEVNIEFDEVRSVAAPYGPSCAIYLTATHRSVRATTGSGEVTEDDLRSRVEANYEVLLALFSKYQRSSAPEEDPITLPVIILIAVAAAILLASIIVIAVLCRRQNRYRRQARLVNNLSVKGTIYDTQEVMVDVDDEASVHSLTGSLATQQLLGEPQPNGDAIGVLNPGYNGSDSTHGDENQDTVTQFTHVEDEQEEADVREEVIVDLSTENTPEQETGETNPDPDYHLPSEEDTSSTNPDYINAEILEDTVPEADYINAIIVPEGQADPQTNDTANMANEPIYAVVNKNKPEVVTEDSRQTEELPPPPLEDADANAVLAEEEEDEEEDLPPPPPTPPRVRKKDAADEEEEVEESPDEPEPDYAKKVRFSEVKVQMIPDPEEEEEEGETGGAETDDEDPTVRTDRPFETIQNPADDISDEGTFVMTQL